MGRGSVGRQSEGRGVWGGMWGGGVWGGRVRVKTYKSRKGQGVVSTHIRMESVLLYHSRYNLTQVL